MPPKMKVLRAHRCSSKSCSDTCSKNPRVILRPFLADFSIQNRYRFNSPPASASLYNKPELSDIKLKVGGDYYYAHRLILSAASEVFSSMLNSEWLEGKSKELELQEEEDCVKVFDRFLFYMYTGSIVLSESYVVPLFMLADKYNVKLLYDECVKVIKNGLKVFVTNKSGSLSPATAGGEDPPMLASLGEADPGFSLGPGSSSQSSSSESSEDLSDSEASPQPSVSDLGAGPPSLPTAGPSSRPSSPQKQTLAAGGPACSPPGPSSGGHHSGSHSSSKTVLVASETFSLSLVMKLIMTCQNESICTAALHNLEARLGNQISLGIFATWNELEQSFLTKILSDRYFYCKECLLFQAAKSWLLFDARRQTEPVISDILSHIRYPLLSPCDLYQVEQDPLVAASARVKHLIHEAVRYQLFKDCCQGEDRNRWVGPQFEERLVRRG